MTTCFVFVAIDGSANNFATVRVDCLSPVAIKQLPLETSSEPMDEEEGESLTNCSSCPFALFQLSRTCVEFRTMDALVSGSLRMSNVFPTRTAILIFF